MVALLPDTHSVDEEIQLFARNAKNISEVSTNILLPVVKKLAEAMSTKPDICMVKYFHVLIRMRYTKKIILASNYIKRICIETFYRKSMTLNIMVLLLSFDKDSNSQYCSKQPCNSSKLRSINMFINSSRVTIFTEKFFFFQTSNTFSFKINTQKAL